MKRTGVIGSILILVVLSALLIPACNKDQFSWKPDVVLVLKPDSGLTTQTFDFRVDMLNLPASQEEFYLRWDLDGDSLWDAPYSSQSTITHRFYQKGNHSVRVEILTEDGQQFTLNRMVSIEQGYSSPHVAFTVDPPIGNYREWFTFDAGKTFDDEDPFSSLLFRWDFENDGVWDTESSSSPVTKFKFKKAATYTVKLSVTDPTRRTTSLTQQLEVNLHDDQILASFTRTPLEATVKDTFYFDASATVHETDPTRTFTYTWDVKSEVTYGPFKEPVFNHVFWAAGTQQVTLTATDEYGLSNSYSEEFFVIKENKPPTPRILVPTPYGNIATTFFFSSWPSTDDATAPSQLLVRWDFEGDGEWDTGWSYEKNVFHQFSGPGTYQVTLQAEDEGGVRAITRLKVLVTASTNPTGYILDRRNGKYYGTVKIDDQWWMSDNLDFRISGKLEIGLLQKCYNEDNAMCDKYGGLYQGDRMVGYNNSGQNICPDGWRLPSREDFMKLGEHIDQASGKSSLMIGGNLGFNAIYAGTANYEIIYNLLPPFNPQDTVYYFKNLSSEARFLSTTIRPFLNDLRSQFYIGIERESPGVYVDWSDHTSFFSVRCIKNE